MRTPQQPPRPTEELLSDALGSIQVRLASARPSQRAKLLQRAGDVCASAGHQRDALLWYGQAIDQLLDLADAESASVLCRMILYVQPEAVRARCTLSWLALAAGRYEEAADRIRSYVAAAEAADQDELAAQQLGWMFDAAAVAPVLRAEIVRLLFSLGMHARRLPAEEVSEEAGTARHRLWSRVVQSAIGDEPQQEP